jgi:TPR repeat protein
MLKNRVAAAAASILLAVVGCSTTPGDAAYRAGYRPQAADLYRTGAAQGDATAALKLGLMIYRGEVPAATYGTASSWFVTGCDLGDTICCHNVGVAYEYGAEEGYPEVTKDLAKAQEYYLRAARRGYMPSQYNLGSM